MYLIVVTSQLDPLTLDLPKGVSENCIMAKKMAVVETEYENIIFPLHVLSK